MFFGLLPDSRPWRVLFYGIIYPGLTLLVSLLTLRTTLLTYVDNYELGYKFDALSGEISTIDHPGYVFAWPLVVSVHTVDLRPMQVCLSANQRTLNCKLVQFNKDGLELFLSWHGRADYGSANLPEILKIYAYGKNPQDFPFLTVISELKDDTVAVSTPVAPSLPTVPSAAASEPTPSTNQ